MAIPVLTQTCAHPDCAKTIRHYEVACRTHWTQLPIRLRNRIWRHHQSANTTKHAEAITEALMVWDPPPPPPARCDTCRTTTDFIDVATEKPICLVCAKSDLEPGVPVDYQCDRCDNTTPLLVSLDQRPPHLCAECAITMTNLEYELARIGGD